MSVTPLRKIPRPSPWAPARRSRPWPGTEPAPLTLRVEITLDGASRSQDAAEVLDALQSLADRLGTGRVTVRPETAGHSSTVDGTGPSGHELAPSITSEIASEVASEIASEVAVAVAPVIEEPPSERTVWIRAGSRIVTTRGKPVEFTRVEYDLLLFLARNPRRVFTRPQLLQIVWGLSHAGERTVDVHIRRLRAKLGDLPLVTTIRGVGYRLADDADLRILDH